MDGAMDASDASMDASGDGSTDASTDGSADGSTDASTDGSMDGSPDASTDGSTDAAADSGVACTSPSDCTAANVMTADCVSGFCTIVTCTSGFDDCDADFATGCETDLALPASCGACGADCGLGGVCTSGTCDRVVGVTVAIETACFTRSSGSVYCVGRNDHGELGIGTTGADSRVLSQVMMLTNGASASAGAHSTCIARGDGTAACIGANDVGQIGNGTMTSASFPRAVSSLTGVTRVATGGLLANNGFACALHTGGAVSCWGHQNGRGDGMLGNTNIPVAVSGLTDAIDLGAGGLFACAVRTGGSVVCWGAAGPWLGPAGTTSRLTPTAVTGITDATRIDADQQHACAVRSTGAVACWGDNNAGRLGADPATTTESATPVAVPGITDAVDVDVGGLTSCALRAGGTVKCWGFGGAAGALGGGATGISFTPVDVIGLTTASALSTGSFASCVLRTDGSVACWGTNELYIGAGPLVAVGWPVPTTHPLFPPTP
jgi:alpha-tubulin suppressor-like RCC1 family protein